MVVFNNSLLTQTLIASGMIVSGVVTKNSVEQLGMPDHIIGKPLGMGLFAGGWLYMAYILSNQRSGNMLMYIVPCLAILGSVIMMKQYMIADETPPMIYPIIFAASWLAIGYLVGDHINSGAIQYSGLIASVLVLLSMMYLLRLQRDNCVVDGPGMPMFVVAFLIISLLNSYQRFAIE